MSDFIVLGGGMAGASAGYFLAGSGNVTLLEMESSFGYHATGRSAALFSEYYGGPAVRALTAASRGFFTAPPAGFTTTPLLRPRGVLALGPAGAENIFEDALASGRTAPVPVREIPLAEVTAHCPVVRPGWYSRAMLKPGAMDIDVDSLHQGFLRGIRARGGQVHAAARVLGLTRHGGRWHADTAAGEFTAPVVVNAAGAWADEVAALAGVPGIGLVPRRRTAILIDPPPAFATADWPMVNDVTGTFYLRPESGALLVSPSDETPVPPGDARPDDLDVAVAAERVQTFTTLTVRRIRHAWAGLRSFVADGEPVTGPDPAAAGFCWHAALGGYGIQTAPAAGRLAAALAAGEPADPALAAALAPGRCRDGSPVA